MKYIEKVDKNFLNNKCDIDPVSIIRFRDFIAHHYEKTDNEIIYDICTEHLKYLKQKISDFLKTYE